MIGTKLSILQNLPSVFRINKHIWGER